MKIDAPLIILLITIASAIAAYWSNVQSTNQLNRMEKYDTLNNKLGKEIKHLSNLNNEIAKRIDTIVSENHSLTEKNIVLSNKANELIEQVEKLTSASNELVKRIDIRTEKSSVENALTGQFDLDYEKPLEDNEMLIVRAGGVTSSNYVGFYKSNNPPRIINMGN